MMAATLERFGDAIRGANPLKRIGEPEDMAGDRDLPRLARRRVRERRGDPRRRRHRRAEVGGESAAAGARCGPEASEVRGRARVRSWVRA